MIERYCRFCHRLLVEFPRIPDEAEQHCASASCHWCMTCERARTNPRGATP